jgi:hypothetical protein
LVWYSDRGGGWRDDAVVGGDWGPLAAGWVFGLGRVRGIPSCGRNDGCFDRGGRWRDDAVVNGDWVGWLPIGCLDWVALGGFLPAVGMAGVLMGRRGGEKNSEAFILA